MKKYGAKWIHDDDVKEFEKNMKEDGWNGNGNPWYWIYGQLNNCFGAKTPVTGELSLWNGGSHFLFKPGSSSYIYDYSNDNLPIKTRELFELSRKRLILRGAIQFMIYAVDDPYEEFINRRAPIYLSWLKSITRYFYSDGTFTERYMKVYWKIYFESRYFFSKKENSSRSIPKDDIDDILGLSRDIPELPKKIDIDQELDRIMKKVKKTIDNIRWLLRAKVPPFLFG